MTTNTKTVVHCYYCNCEVDVDTGRCAQCDGDTSAIVVDSTKVDALTVPYPTTPIDAVVDAAAHAIYDHEEDYVERHTRLLEERPTMEYPCPIFEDENSK